MPPKIQGEYPANWREIAAGVKKACGGRCLRCGHEDDLPSGHLFTVHHFDGDKGNAAWWNLLGLCQRCHLSVQGRVNPDQRYFLEHSAWLKPYVAGYYAFKYEGEQLSREQVMARLDQLLAHESLT